MFVQSTRVSEKSRVIASPILVAVMEMKKAGIFDANAIAGISAINFLEQSVSVLKGIGPGGAKALEGRGFYTLNDLIKNSDRGLVGLVPRVAVTANEARKVMIKALERNGISVEVRPSVGITTMAIAVDPVTGITYNT